MELKTPTDKLIAELWILEIKLKNLRGALDTPEARAKLESEIEESRHKIELAKLESQKGPQSDSRDIAAPDVIDNTGKLAENSQQDVVDSPEAKKRTLSEHIGSSQDSEARATKSRRTGPLSAPESASLTLLKSEVLSNISSDAKPRPSQISSLSDSYYIDPYPSSVKSDPVSTQNAPAPASIGSANFIDFADNGSLTTMKKSDITNLFIDIEENNSAEDEKRLAETLTCTLLEHQKIALEWMKKNESNKNKCGGILADGMGLGKTLSMIALMLCRKAKPSSTTKTNLVVIPVSLLEQWKREIAQMIVPKHRLQVFIYHGKKAVYSHLSKYHIVVTTYGTLASELAKLDKYVRECKDEEVAVNDSELARLSPLLGPKSMFLRVILDEAHMIKNPRCQASKAVFKLKANYRWCITGTPMQNGVRDMASLIHFLRIEPYCNFRSFKSAFQALYPGNTSPQSMKDNALAQFQVLLEAICLRRSKDSKINDKPIIELKRKIETVDHAVFSADEDELYQNLQKDTRVIYKGYLRSGKVRQNFAKVLSMLLRLRQACCHPLLNITDLEIVDPDAPDDSSVDAAKSLSLDIIERIKVAEAFECSSCHEATTNPAIMSPCGDYFCKACIQGWLNSMAQGEIHTGGDQGEVKCPTCGRSVSSKFINYDIFKKVHMQETVNDDEYNKLSDTDHNSSDYLPSGYIEADEIDNDGNLKNFVVEDHVEDWTDGDKTPNNEPKNKSKSEAKFHPHMLVELRKEARSNKAAQKRYMRALRNIALPSAKVTKCCEIISTIQETTQEKIIIFSEWTLLLDILELAIKDQLGMSVCRYDGGMSSTKRDKVVLKFTSDPEAKIILVSLKAGNAGLNLTAASQVIIMDPFWNPYVEMQAVDRAHRLGQQREVTVHRILVQGTIEDRILEIQELKRSNIEAALDEEAREKIGKLGTAEIEFLFGFGKKPGSK
ncbi:SNF2 family N-terminal domain-containing protein [Hypoxylon sp. FL0890]|nr:SNF2 family N-terminal domain-containing protein [Hypoxylon sp. FL0890]